MTWRWIQSIDTSYIRVLLGKILCKVPITVRKIQVSDALRFFVSFRVCVHVRVACVYENLPLYNQLKNKRTKQIHSISINTIYKSIRSVCMCERWKVQKIKSMVWTMRYESLASIERYVHSQMKHRAWFIVRNLLNLTFCTYSQTLLQPPVWHNSNVDALRTRSQKMFVFSLWFLVLLNSNALHRYHAEAIYPN